MLINSCGTNKLPTKIIQEKINPTDQDFDFLTTEQEKKLGSNPLIPDYPLLSAKLEHTILLAI